MTTAEGEKTAGSARGEACREIETYWYRKSAVAVLKLHAPLTDGLAVALEQAITRLLARGLARVVVNLGDVAFATSTGIQVLLRGRDEARALGGDLVLVETPKSVLWVVEQLGLTDAFQFLWKERHALQALTTPSAAPDLLPNGAV